MFGTPLVLRRVWASWFTGQLGQLFGAAWLVQVTDGPKTGLVIGLTPHSLGEITDDIAAAGWKTVVVHGVDFPGHDPDKHGPRSVIGGMAALERL